LLDRQVGRSRPLQDPIDVRSGAPKGGQAVSPRR
jgi:hypothetical protein